MIQYLDILKKLSKQGVKYLIAGGFAANLYGVERATRDIDLIVDFERENLESFESIVKSFGFSERVPLFVRDLWDQAYRKKLLEEKNMMAFSYHDHRKGFLVIDVLLNFPKTFQEMWDDKQVREVDGTEIYLVSVQHLIEMKTIANREQDQFDIVQLKRLYA